MVQRNFLLVAAAMFLLALSLAACGPQITPEPAPATFQVPTAEDSAEGALETAGGDEPQVLRMALIPVLDVLPFFIAQDSGYFADEGIAVEFFPTNSALEREQLLAAGEVDGMLTDVIGPAITNAAAEPSVRIVAVARRAFDGAPLFRLLAAPGSGLATPHDLAGVPIGISENSVIQYLAVRMLERAGVAEEEISFESIPAIPIRFSLMMEGQLKASILPDPLASAAIAAGAILVVDDTIVVDEQLSQSVLSFSSAVLSEKPEAVRAFLRAWTRAVEDLNANPDDFRQLLLDNTSVPDSVKDTYVIPSFPLGEITSESVWNDVNAWLVGRGIIDTPASYADSVDPTFLPE
jgi:NitT/TauT family transport system substrate-binding protein